MVCITLNCMGISPALYQRIPGSIILVFTIAHTLWYYCSLIASRSELLVRLIICCMSVIKPAKPLCQSVIFISKYPPIYRKRLVYWLDKVQMTSINIIESIMCCCTMSLLIATVYISQFRMCMLTYISFAAGLYQHMYCSNIFKSAIYCTNGIIKVYISRVCHLCYDLSRL